MNFMPPKQSQHTTTAAALFVASDFGSIEINRQEAGMSCYNKLLRLVTRLRSLSGSRSRLSIRIDNNHDRDVSTTSDGE